MSEQSDTLASVAAELAKVLEPLHTELLPLRAKGFFGEMGITLTDPQAAALAGPLDTIVTSTDALLALIPQIIAAIEAEDWGTVTTKAIRTAVRVGEVVSAID